MRFNEKELTKVADGPAVIEGILNHLKPQGNDWSDWYPQPTYKERTFKLISNLLFYFRVNEIEPLGVLVLENAQVAYERPSRETRFSFSITFKGNDKLRDNEGKHIFSCRCNEDVAKWVAALKTSSYEYWRSQYTILKTKISMRTGQDPVLNYVRKNEENKRTENIEKVEAKKSTFYTHIETKAFFESKTITKTVLQSSDTVAVGTLIEL